MKPLTDEWIFKAEGDFSTAQRESTVVENPNYDAVCFHAQQCAEKYLKAILTEYEIHFPRTHDLMALLELVVSRYPQFKDLENILDTLTDQAVEIRYPGMISDFDDAVTAMDSATEVRKSVRTFFQLENSC